MLNRFCARTVMASVLALVGMTLGCGESSPTGPSHPMTPVQPTTPAAPAAPPVVTAISPNLGSTDGGTQLQISGSGFRGTGYQSGVTVTFGGAAVKVDYVNSGRIWIQAPAHAAGQVDVIVGNSDGQTATVPGGYTYALPQSFDPNGEWAGWAYDETPMRFIIQNNTLVSASCGTAETLTFSPPPPVRNGEFSFTGEGGIAMSGRIVSAAAAAGTINMAQCTATEWYAEK